MAALEEAEENTASEDELAIFIDSEGTYRVLIPNSWSGSKMPEFAYLAVAAILRLARKDEIEFSKSLARWAKTALDEAKASGRPRTSKH